MINFTEVDDLSVISDYMTVVSLAFSLSVLLNNTLSDAFAAHDDW